MNLPELKEAFPVIFKKKEISIRDMTYMTRNVFAYFQPRDELFEKGKHELMALCVRHPQWNWLETDIDDATPLHYGLMNQVDDFCDMLLSQKYDISTYHPVLAQALMCTMRPRNKHYFLKIIHDPQLHVTYRNDFALRSVSLYPHHAQNMGRYQDDSSHLLYADYLLAQPEFQTPQVLAHVVAGLAQNPKHEAWRCFVSHPMLDTAQVLELADHHFTCLQHEHDESTRKLNETLGSTVRRHPINVRNTQNYRSYEKIRLHHALTHRMSQDSPLNERSELEADTEANVVKTVKIVKKSKI